LSQRAISKVFPSLPSSILFNQQKKGKSANAFSLIPTRHSQKEKEKGTIKKKKKKKKDKKTMESVIHVVKNENSTHAAAAYAAAAAREKRIERKPQFRAFNFLGSWLS
jgi:hypothetical protein